MTRRIALGVEYDGSLWNGWQAQRDPHRFTVQETLESALALPLTGLLESARPLLAHEPIELRAGSEIGNRDSVPGQLVLCGRHAPPS